MCATELAGGIALHVEVWLLSASYVLAASVFNIDHPDFLVCTTELAGGITLHVEFWLLSAS